MNINDDWQGDSNWDDELRALAKRCGRGLEGEMHRKFIHYINEMKHLTNEEQLGEFLLVYVLGGQADEALHRAMKAMRIRIGVER